MLMYSCTIQKAPDDDYKAKYIEVVRHGSAQGNLESVTKWLKDKSFEIDTVYKISNTIRTKPKKFDKHISTFDIEIKKDTVIVGGMWLPSSKEALLLKPDYKIYFNPIENTLRAKNAFSYMTDLAKSLGQNVKFKK